MPLGDISYNYNLDPTFCCLLYGIGTLLPIGEALIHAPKTPAQQLLGKSPEWVNAYTKAYQASMKKRNLGCNIDRLFNGDSGISTGTPNPRWHPVEMRKTINRKKA